MLDSTCMHEEIRVRMAEIHVTAVPGMHVFGHALWAGIMRNIFLYVNARSHNGAHLQACKQVDGVPRALNPHVQGLALLHDDA